jgi:LPS sulfotransferase NodH
LSLIDPPIVIVSTPRSGSTLLFETLARAPGLFTTGRESHMRIERLSDFAPHKRNRESNRLTASSDQPAAE